MARAGRVGMDIDPDMLAAARREAGLSMAQLAQLTGLSRQMIWQYESELARPSPATLERIADKLGKPAAWFLRQGDAKVTLRFTYIPGPLGGSLRIGVQGANGQERAIAPLHLDPREWMALRTLTGSRRLQVEFDEVGT